MKKIITIFILTIVACVTFGQGVYDDFIYTRSSMGQRDLIRDINRCDTIWAAYLKSNLFIKHNRVAGDIEKLLRNQDIKDLKIVLNENKILVNDIDFFWHQVDESKNIFSSFKSLDSRTTFKTDADGMNKTTVLYNYTLTQDNVSLNYRLYIIFHWQHDITKSMDIMLVKMPKDMVTTPVYDDYIHTH